MTSVLACEVCLYVLSGIYSCNVSFAMQCNAMRGFWVLVSQVLIIFIIYISGNMPQFQFQVYLVGFNCIP